MNSQQLYWGAAAVFACVALVRWDRAREHEWHEAARYFDALKFRLLKLSQQDRRRCAEEDLRFLTVRAGPAMCAALLQSFRVQTFDKLRTPREEVECLVAARMIATRLVNLTSEGAGIRVREWLIYIAARLISNESEKWRLSSEKVALVTVAAARHRVNSLYRDEEAWASLWSTPKISQP
jgi:hypothetical protein